MAGVSTLGSGGSGQAILQYQGSQRLKTQSWGVEITNALSANNIVATAADSSFAGSSFTDNVTVGSGITLSPDGDIFAVGVSTFTDTINAEEIKLTE